MRWQGRRESDNVEDRRNSSGGPSMGGPGFRLPSGKGGLILLIVVLVAGYYGVDLTGLMTGQPVSQQQSTRSISPNEDEAAKFTSVILATTEELMVLLSNATAGLNVVSTAAIRHNAILLVKAFNFRGKDG